MISSEHSNSKLSDDQNKQYLKLKKIVKGTSEINLIVSIELKSNHFVCTQDAI